MLSSNTPGWAFDVSTWTPVLDRAGLVVLHGIEIEDPIIRDQLYRRHFEFTEDILTTIPFDREGSEEFARYPGCLVYTARCVAAGWIEGLTGDLRYRVVDAELEVDPDPDPPIPHPEGATP